MDTNYIYPDIDFLRHNDNSRASQSDDGSNLIAFLKLMKVSAKIAYVETSSVSVLYAIELAPGVRVSKVTCLQHELSVELQAIEIQFMIPIPGTSYLGIRAVKPDAPQVLLGDFLHDDTYLKSDNSMEVVLGRMYDGKPAYYDFKKLTHLLISGTTGSGKSIFIDSIIVNLIYKASPEELRLILIDTHGLNLLRFDKLPHLILPVVTDIKKTLGALSWAVAEMDIRYKLLSEYGVKNIEAYNELMHEQGQEKLPRILIIVDDLADVMLAYQYDIQADIERLVSMSRAAGIHLLLSIQRPSSDVVSSTIKMNIPNRIAFRTVSANDSRLVIQSSGAEQLRGNGEMLFKKSGQQDPVRIQGPFVSDEEIDYIVKFVTRNYSRSPFKESGVKKESIKKDNDEIISDIYDEYVKEAGKIIIEKQKATVGMLQREFRIGFNFASRIMDILTELSVVGPEEGIKPRKILMGIEEFQRMLNEKFV